MTYEIYAIKYGSHDRQSNENFIDGDDHSYPMPIDYYVWLIRNATRTVLVDTGFGPESAQKRGRLIHKTVEEGLRALDVKTEHIEHVIITHLHYDHAGNIDLFKNAVFHLQDLEMEYATGRDMCHENMRRAYDVDDVVQMVRKVYQQRVMFHKNEDVIIPGVSVFHVGGHTKGLQCVLVETARGNVILASDASHFYANMERRKAFPIVYNLGDMMEGFNQIERRATTKNHIIPGHDPKVLELYSPPDPSLKGWIARLDLEPRSI